MHEPQGICKRCSVACEGARLKLLPPGAATASARPALVCQPYKVSPIMTSRSLVQGGSRRMSPHHSEYGTAVPPRAWEVHVHGELHGCYMTRDALSATPGSSARDFTQRKPAPHAPMDTVGAAVHVVCPGSTTVLRRRTLKSIATLGRCHMAGTTAYLGTSGT